MRWLVDAQLPRRVAQQLVWLGDDASHTLDLPLGNATPDAHLVALAQQSSAVVITKDADFVNHFHVHGAPRLLLISTGNLSNHILIELITQRHGQLVEAFEVFDFLELSREHLLCHA